MKSHLRFLSWGIHDILSFRKKTHTTMWKMNQNEKTGYGHPSEANIIARVKTKGGPKLKQDCN